MSDEKTYRVAMPATVEFDVEAKNAAHAMKVARDIAQKTSGEKVDITLDWNAGEAGVYIDLKGSMEIVSVEGSDEAVEELCISVEYGVSRASSEFDCQGQDVVDSWDKAIEKAKLWDALSAAEENVLRAGGTIIRDDNSYIKTVKY